MELSGSADRNARVELLLSKAVEEHRDLTDEEKALAEQTIFQTEVYIARWRRRRPPEWISTAMRGTRNASVSRWKRSMITISHSWQRKRSNCSTLIVGVRWL